MQVASVKIVPWASLHFNHTLQGFIISTGHDVIYLICDYGIECIHAYFTLLWSFFTFLNMFILGTLDLKKKKMVLGQPGLT